MPSRAMRIDVSTSAVIARPRAEVARYAGDPSNAPEWYANIQSVRWLTPPGTVEPGAKMQFVARFLRRELVYTYEIVEHRPGERLVMRTAEGPFPMETEYRWEDAAGEGPPGAGGPAGATRMTIANRGEPAGFTGVFAPLMARAVRSANRKDLRKLREVLEGS